MSASNAPLDRDQTPLEARARLRPMKALVILDRHEVGERPRLSSERSFAQEFRAHPGQRFNCGQTAPRTSSSPRSIGQFLRRRLVDASSLRLDSTRRPTSAS
jgi:hypothetical protein